MSEDIWEELEELWSFVVGEGENFSLKPPVNVFEGRDCFIVQVALAGVPEDEIEVEFKNGTLIVKGNRKDSHANQKGKYHSLEIPFGPFERRIPIRGKIKEEEISIKYRNGLLEVIIPKIVETNREE
jgi:HSP20 family protein